MIDTAKTYKRLAALVLVGAFFLGGGVSYVVNKNKQRIDEGPTQKDINEAVHQSQVNMCIAGTVQFRAIDRELKGIRLELPPCSELVPSSE